jgi:hypothetical protein
VGRDGGTKGPLATFELERRCAPFTHQAHGVTADVVARIGVLESRIGETDDDQYALGSSTAFTA